MIQAFLHLKRRQDRHQQSTLGDRLPARQWIAPHEGSRGRLNLRRLAIERSRADQIKAEQIEAERINAEHIKAEHIKAEQSRAEQNGNSRTE